MIVPLITFIVVCITSYAGFLKLAARILRYSVPWKSAFLFAGLMLVIVMFGHVLVLSESLATRIGYNIVLWAGQIAFGSWFFSGHQPPGYNPRVVRWLAVSGIDVCNDACFGVRDRYAGSDFSHQSPFPGAVTG